MKTLLVLIQMGLIFSVLSLQGCGTTMSTGYGYDDDVYVGYDEPNYYPNYGYSTYYYSGGYYNHDGYYHGGGGHGGGHGR